MEFSAEIEALPQMLDYIRTSLGKSRVSKPDGKEVELACEEALVNIIMHGEAGRAPIVIECEKKTHHFEVTIRDRGVPFNPSDVEIDPKIDRPLEERKVGGLGLYLIRQLAQEISYRRLGEENVLTIGFLL